MQLITKIGNTGTKVQVQFTLDEERDINWDELKVYLYEHPDVDITDLIGDEWSLEISEEIYANADKLVQEEQDDAIIEAHITDSLFKE
jgi:cytochrome oxidase Cu insertion factor (SCO1/SenC/PrrC family)